MILDYYYSTVPKEKLDPDINELAARLGVDRKSDMSFAKNAIDELKKASNAKYSAVRCQAFYRDEDEVDIGFGFIKSRDLCRCLRKCDEVIIAAITLGISVDMIIKRKAASSQSDGFIYDAVSSGMAEKACDLMQLDFEEEFRLRPRFSVGYGVLELVHQKKVLEIVNASRLLGINLGKDLLMSPMKSITCIMGINK